MRSEKLLRFGGEKIIGELEHMPLLCFIKAREQKACNAGEKDGHVWAAWGNEWHTITFTWWHGCLGGIDSG